jgi:hypothetical protein
MENRYDVRFSALAYIKVAIDSGASGDNVGNLQLETIVLLKGSQVGQPQHAKEDLELVAHDSVIGKQLANDALEHQTLQLRSRLLVGEILGVEFELEVKVEAAGREGGKTLE